jgi:hypothetical protein
MKPSRFFALAALITGFNILLIHALPSVVGGQEMSAQAKKMMEQMMKYGAPAKGMELVCTRKM